MQSREPPAKIHVGALTSVTLSARPAPAARARVVVALLAVALVGCPPAAIAPHGRDTAHCAKGMAYVAAKGATAFCIDRWEGSIVDGEGSTETPHSPYEPIREGEHARAVSRPDVVPQGYISQLEAKAACLHAGKRLCSADEWSRACRGTGDTTFPYGSERHRGYCNDTGHAPLATLYPGTSAYASASAMNDPRINQASGTVAKTGAHHRCTNGYGVYDMVGNLHEWTAEVSGSHGTFRGGYYQDTMQNGAGCGYRTVAHALEYHDYSTGFRCCADAR